MTRKSLGRLGLGLIVAGAVILSLAAIVGPPPNATVEPEFAYGVLPGFGQLPVGPGGMMGWTPAGPDRWGPVAPGPGAPGFVAGTPAAPRVVQIIATGAIRFVPDTVTVRQGETIEFLVTSMGMATHEFMVGPAADVAADRAGTPEVADIGMMQTKSLVYTFDGPGPFAYACHAPGHFEAGMVGTIVVLP